jgi:plasmid stabilization system protein ParE
VTQLRQHPLSGRIVPEMGNPVLRELVEAPYRIIYTITTKPRSVVIVAVHHGKRRLGGTGDEG